MARISASEGGLTKVQTAERPYWMQPTLADLEGRLDPARFFRVSRSAIVNLDHLVSCKPIDRRLCLKLSDGSEVIASRSGSRNLRDLFV